MKEDLRGEGLGSDVYFHPFGHEDGRILEAGCSGQSSGVVPHLAPKAGAEGPVRNQLDTGIYAGLFHLKTHRDSSLTGSCKTSPSLLQAAIRMIEGQHLLESCSQCSSLDCLECERCEG